MISADRALISKSGMGDAIKRHKAYAEAAGVIDIIVVGKGSVSFKGVSPQVHVYLTNTSKLFHLWGVMKIAKKLFSQNTYDLIVSQDLASPAGFRLKNKYNIPLLVGVHSLFYKKGLLSFNVINQWGVSQIRKAIKNSDGLRVNNFGIKDELAKWGVTAPILVQPTPVDIEKFIAEKKERHSVPHILYVGRLSPEKNVQMLIKAIQAISYELKATVVGDGPEKMKLEDLAKGDPRISFAGAQPYKNLPQFYKEADIFVLPSNSESFGKVLIEAAAAQCAIVATKTAGAKSILTHEKDAILTGVGDKKAFEMALESLCNDLGRQKALGEQALQTARKYSFKEGCERIVEFWEKIAKGI